MPRRNYNPRRGRRRPHAYDGAALARLIADLQNRRQERTR